MNLSSSRSVKIAFIVGLVLIVAAFVFVAPGTPVPTAPSPTPTTTPMMALATTSPTSSEGASQARGDAAKPANPSAIGKSIPVPVFITPVANDDWVMTLQNPISWTRPGGVSGQLVLINAQTKKVAGVILSEVGPAQTSYAWNTRDIFISRTNPAKITVTPGAYQIMLSYDGNNLPPIMSPIFMIVAQ